MSEIDINDLQAFASVARTRSFRQAARMRGVSASTLSDALRRLEARLGVRLLNRTTRSVTATEAGQRLLERLAPALTEITAALDTLNGFRTSPTGVLRLNVPTSFAGITLPAILAAFSHAYPDITVEVMAEDGFVDVLAAGCDAGIRYDERLERDMIAVPIGPRVQRFVTAAAPAYLARHPVPQHPRDLMHHACIRHRFNSGAGVVWEFERDAEVVRIDPPGPLIANWIALEVEGALAGLGVIHTFEGFVRAALDSGRLVDVLPGWAPTFPGPFLYYPSRRHMPAPLRAFTAFIRHGDAA